MSSPSADPSYGHVIGTCPGSESPAIGLVAVYGPNGLAPAVTRTEYKTPLSFTRELIDIAFSCASECTSGDSPIPIEVFSELIGNLIHAGYADPVISVLESGRVLRVADCGPGILDKQLAIQPGYTSATASHRKYIRGVGAGLHIVKCRLEALGGSLTIDQNIGGGAVVTASLVRETAESPLGVPADNKSFLPSGALREQRGGVPLSSPGLHSTAELPPQPVPVAANEDFGAKEPAGSVHLLSPRQREVLYLVMAASEAGPTTVANTLGIALTTAYRDLELLERMDLVKRTEDGKRVPTETLMQSSAIWRNL